MSVVNIILFFLQFLASLSLGHYRGTEIHHNLAIEFCVDWCDTDDWAYYELTPNGINSGP